MIEPSGFCADLEFALVCVRGALAIWSFWIHINTLTLKKVMSSMTLCRAGEHEAKTNASGE